MILFPRDDGDVYDARNAKIRPSPILLASPRCDKQSVPMTDIKTRLAMFAYDEDGISTKC